MVSLGFVGLVAAVVFFTVVGLREFNVKFSYSNLFAGVAAFVIALSALLALL